MQKSLTWILLGATVVLAGVIMVLERNVPGTEQRKQPAPLFPNANWSEVSSIAVAFASGERLVAEKTNDAWTLRNPSYPAQEAAIENFLTNLASIRRLDGLLPQEVALQGTKSFGLEPPRASVEVVTGTNRLAFEIGGRAPLTNNIYLRLFPSNHVVLASAQAGELLPPSALAWRDPRVIDLAAVSFDQVRVRTGQRTFELSRNPTNKTWRITRPVPTRANQQRVAGLMDTLRTATVAAYVADAPPDLERFGLHAPDLELVLLNGTNRVYGIEFGASVTNNADFLYARVAGRSNVVAVPRELADFVRQPYKNFNEPQLVNLPAVLDRVVVESTENFVLQRDNTGRWTETHDGQTIPLDLILLGRFLTNVQAIEILDIVKEVPTDADLRNFGLATPRVAISFYQRVTNANAVPTNALFTQIVFGTNQADRVFARRSDEIPVYSASLADLMILPDEAFELRDRRVWSIPPGDVVKVTLANASGTNALQRAPNGAWSDDAISNEAIGEAVLRLCSLEAVEWTSKGENRKPALGIRENPLTLTVHTRTETYTVQFGTETMQRNIYAAVNLPGVAHPVIFQFPGLLFHSLIQLLPVPK